MPCKITYKGKRYNNDAALQLDVLKDRNLLDRYNELYNRLVDSAILDIGEIEKFEDAKQQLLNILPDNVFTITDKSNLLDRVLNNGITFGYLDNKVIYLATNAPMGNAYHEAFHAVFRTFLNDNDIQKYLDLAKDKYGKVSDTELNSFKQQSSSYANLSKQQLENLWYEEKIANDFSQYMLNKKPKTTLGKLFAKLKQIIDYFFNTGTSLEQLFENISLGQFRTAKPVHNIYRTSPAAFNLISSIGFDDLTSTSVQQLRGKLYFGLLNIGKNEIENTETTKQLVSKLLKDGYNLSLWESQLQDLSIDKRAGVMSKIATMYNAVSLDDHYEQQTLDNYVLVPNTDSQRNKISKNLDSIIEYTNVKLKELENSTIDEDELEEDDDNVTDQIKDVNSNTKGSYDRQPKAVKQMIETTPYYDDIFNIGKTLDEINKLPEEQKELYLTFNDGSYVFNTIRKQITDLDKTKLFDTIININNKLTNPFIDVILTKIVNELNTNQFKIDGKVQYINKDNIYDYSTNILFLQHLGNVSNTYNTLVQAFHSTRDLYVGLFDDSIKQPKLVVLSNKDQAEQLAQKWGSTATVNKLTPDVFKEQIDAIISVFESFQSNLFTPSLLTKRTLDDRIDNIESTFKNMGITIPRVMIESNIINNYIANEANINNLTEQEVINNAKEKIKQFDAKDKRTLKRLLSLVNIKSSLGSQSRTKLSGKLDLSNDGILKRMSRFRAPANVNPINAMLNTKSADFVLISLANEVLNYDNSGTNASVLTVDNKKMYSINPPHFMSELMATLKSEDMKVFIRYLNRKDYLKARTKLDQIFGLNTKYGYSKHLLDKLFISYKNNPILINKYKTSALAKEDPTKLVTMLANNIVLYAKGTLDGKDQTAASEEYSKLDAVQKIRTKLGLYSRDLSKTEQSVAEDTRHFVTGILESKTIHRIFNAPINIGNLKDTYYTAYRMSLKTEFDLIRNEVQNVTTLYNNKTTIADDVFLLEGYNYVRSKTNNNIYIPVFSENGAFIKFVNLRRNYTEEGDFTGVTVVEDNGGLSEKDIPRAFKLFEFKDMQGAREIELAARGVTEFDKLLNINSYLESFHRLKMTNFITKLQDLELISETSIQIKEC